MPEELAGEDILFFDVCRDANRARDVAQEVEKIVYHELFIVFLSLFLIHIFNYSCGFFGAYFWQ